VKKNIKIENHFVGIDHPCFIIGEIGSNHNRDKQTVYELIDACSEAGFDAVKFQIYDPEAAFSKNEITTDVGLEHLYGKKPWWEIARDVILMPRDWFEEMFDYARSKKLIPLSAIHRREDAEFLLNFGLSAFKIASIDLYYHQLFEDLEVFKKPMIISTGMAYMHEIAETIQLLERKNIHEIVLLHCISCYPPNPEQMNMNNIPMLQQSFDVPIGFSDHSTGITSAIIAVTLGAKIIEKHITLDKNYPGPDHPFALEPIEMIKMAAAIRETELSLGQSNRILSHGEINARKMIRRSIVTKVEIKKGEEVTIDKIKFARPGTGIPTNEFKYIDGRKLNHDVTAESILNWNMFTT
jgi:sialic acid synthase SpsE